jgi:hypothetical protein
MNVRRRRRRTVRYSLELIANFDDFGEHIIIAVVVVVSSSSSSSSSSSCRHRVVVVSSCRRRRVVIFVVVVSSLRLREIGQVDIAGAGSGESGRLVREVDARNGIIGFTGRLEDQVLKFAGRLVFARHDIHSALAQVNVGVRAWAEPPGWFGYDW